MIGVLTPWMLLGIPLALGILVAVYKKGGKKTAFKVPTLFILRNFATQPVRRKTKIFPLRFWVELLFLSLIILAASGIWREKESKVHTLLIDNSFSMSARQGDSTKLEVAKREAILYLREQNSNDLYRIYITTPSLRSLSSGDILKANAEDQIKTINFEYGEDRIESALTDLSQNCNCDSIKVFTDHRKKENSNDNFIKISTIEEQEKQRNIWITKINYDPTRPSIAVSIDGEGEGEIFLYSINGVKQKKEINRKKYNSKEREIIFTEIPPLNTAFEVKIIPQAGKEKDAILEDNSAWIVTERSSAIGYYGEGEIADLRLPIQLPYTIQKRSDKNEKARIYRGVIPKELPEISSLIIAPSEDSDFLKIGNVSTSRLLTYWKNSSEIFQYLKLQSIKIQKTTFFRELPSWTESLAKIDEGAVIATGIKDGRKYGFVGFDLFPFEGKESTTVSILTLNLFKWIFEDNINSGVLINAALPNNVKKAQYLAQNISSGEKSRGIGRISEPGLLELEYVDGSKKQVAINSFLYSESSMEQRTINTEIETSNVISINSKKSLIEYLIYLSIATLFIDLILAPRRSRRIST